MSACVHDRFASDPYKWPFSGPSLICYVNSRSTSVFRSKFLIFTLFWCLFCVRELCRVRLCVTLLHVCFCICYSTPLALAPSSDLSDDERLLTRGFCDVLRIYEEARYVSSYHPAIGFDLRRYRCWHVVDVSFKSLFNNQKHREIKPAP